MRVLHVVPDLAPGGGTPAAALGLTRALAREGLQLALVATNKGAPPALRVPGVDLHLADCRLARWRWAPTITKILEPLIARSDVVELHGLWLHPTLSAARLCRAHGVPYVVTPCGMLDRWSLGRRAWRKRLYARLVERRTLYGAAALRFTSEAELERSETLGSLAPHCVVPLGLPPEAWDGLPPFGAFRRSANLGGRRVVLFLGRLDAKKRPDLLLRAFAIVARDVQDAHLVLAGPGAAGYVARLQAEARELGLDGRVVFPGLLIGRTVQEALVDADVFVLPSLQENFALAVAEAMAAGCPVIVSPHVALAADVEKHEAGLVVDLEEFALAKALRELLCSDDRRRCLGQNGRRLVLERYTWDRIVHQMIEVYDDILQRTRTSQAWK